MSLQSMYFFVKLDNKKAKFITLMHKNSILSYISPSFIGAGAPCPHPSMKAYSDTKEEIMTT